MPGTVRSLNGDKASGRAGGGRHGRGRGQRALDRRALPRGRAAGEAQRRATPATAPAPVADGSQSVEGVRRELRLPRDRDPAPVVELKGGSRMTVLCPNTDEAERQSLPGRRSRREAFLDAGAHPPRARIRRRARDRRPPGDRHAAPRRRALEKTARAGAADRRPAGPDRLRGVRARRGLQRPRRRRASKGRSRRPRPAARRAASLLISNWPAYIDSKTIPEFEQETGIDGRVHRGRQRQQRDLREASADASRSGDSAGRSIVVVTDWMAKKMYDLGYLQNFDKNAIPEVKKNMLPSLRSPTFDPERQFSAAVAERHDRPRRQHRRGAGRDQYQRPARRPGTGKARSPC